MDAYCRRWTWEFVISVRALKTEISVPELLFFRALIGLITITAVMIPNQGFRFMVAQRPALQLVRNVIHVSAQYCIFFAVISLPLAVITAIEYSVPALSQRP